MAQKTWKDYFHFSKAEKYGVYFVVALILLVGSLNFFIPHFIHLTSSDFSEFKKDIEKLKEKDKTAKNNENNQVDFDELNRVEYSLFNFDPNKATKEELLKLGIKVYVIDNMIKYRTKGGRFKKKEDLKKIFGFDPETYKRLEPFIVINETSSEYQKFEKFDDKKESKVFLQIDVNSATATEFQQIKGIGAVFSKRIVEYRELLGGYHAIDQILEVYGIDSSVFNSIKDQLIIQELNLKQISLNFASIKELSAHPYIDYATAKLIFNERVKNGPFNSIDDLNKRCLKDDFLIEKISPYLQIW